MPALVTRLQISLLLPGEGFISPFFQILPKRLNFVCSVFDLKH